MSTTKPATGWTGAPERVFLKACHPESPNQNCTWTWIGSEPKEGSVEYVRADLLVSKEAVNKILYDGYQRHLHECTNSVGAAEFIHGLQKAVTALPAADFEQLAALRDVSTRSLYPLEYMLRNNLVPDQFVGPTKEIVAAIRNALGLPES